MNQHLLLVDDDLFLASSLSRLFTANGFEVTAVHTMADAWIHLQRHEPDLLILDLSLPDGDGNEFCRRVRARSELPILMLTSRGNSIDKVTGLGLGADDYLTKPFDPHELVARIRALLRRANGSKSAPEPTLVVGDITISVPDRLAMVCGEELPLTPTEFGLLRFLVEHVDRTVERNELFQAVWGYDSEFASNTLDVLIYRVRGKLKAAGAQQTIVTLRGHGFRLRSA